MSTRRVFVPLVVAALALGLWYWSGPRDAPVVDLPDDARVCTDNLRALYAGLRQYADKTGHAPTGSGPEFLTCLFTEGVWADTPDNRARLVCPGTGKPYAARAASAHPLAHFPSGGAELEPLAACDGASRMPHKGCMNVLYSDGSVKTLMLDQEIERGEVPKGATSIAVGKDSPIEELRKLVRE